VIANLAAWNQRVEIIFSYASKIIHHVFGKRIGQGKLLESQRHLPPSNVPKRKETSHLYNTNPKASCMPNPGNSCPGTHPFMFHPGTTNVCFSLIRTIKSPDPNIWDTLVTFLGNFNPVCVLCKIHFDYVLGSM
jgi:hypothetical protein